MTSSGAVPPSRPASAAKRSYFRSALATPANRIATAITLIVALPVFAWSQLPLANGLEVDLRQSDFGTPALLSLYGFSEPTAEGRGFASGGATQRFQSLTGYGGLPEVRVVFHRPLPERFAVRLEGSAPGSGRIGSMLEVSIGEQRARLTFGRKLASRRVQVESSGGVREIALRAAEGSPEAAFGDLPTVVLRRLIIE